MSARCGWCASRKPSTRSGRRRSARWRRRSVATPRRCVFGCATPSCSATSTGSGTENFRVYGVRKVRRLLRRAGIEVARCTVARPMRAMGLRGTVRDKTIRATVSDKAAPCPLDRVNRDFKAPRPDVLRVADFSYVASWTGFVHVAFVIDAVARRIVGRRVSRTATAGVVLDTLEQALHARRPRPKPPSTRPRRAGRWPRRTQTNQPAHNPGRTPHRRGRAPDRARQRSGVAAARAVNHEERPMRESEGRDHTGALAMAADG